VGVNNESMHVTVLVRLTFFVVCCLLKFEKIPVWLERCVNYERLFLLDLPYCCLLSSEV
jgi:hypothetical protein